MITVKDAISQTDFDSVSKEVKIHYGEEHMEKLKDVYTRLKNMQSKKNINNMVIFIRVLKENEKGDEDIVIQEFDTNDNTLMFDVCGEDNQYDGLYSIASSEYDELLDYYIEDTTLHKFTFSQIVAHILWEIEW